MRAFLFYAACLAAAFGFGFPFGPSSLEMLRLAGLKKRRQAWTMAFGVATANAAWALTALIGIRPVFRRSGVNLEGVFFLITAALCMVFGMRAWRERQIHVEAVCAKRERPLSSAGIPLRALAKGMAMGLAYPLTIGSWVIFLAFLRKSGLRAPTGIPNTVLFLAMVFAGYFSYFALLLFLSDKMQRLFTPAAAARWHRRLGMLLLGLAGLFLYFSLKSFFRTK